MRKIIALIAISVIATSCSTVRMATSTSAAVDLSITQYPIVVDLEIAPEVASTEVRWSYVESLLKSATIKRSQSTIIFDMLKNHNADVLVEERVQMTKVPFGETTIIITGYPAKFKNFRKATKEEIKEISQLRGQKDIYIIDNQ